MIRFNFPLSNFDQIEKKKKKKKNTRGFKHVTDLLDFVSDGFIRKTWTESKAKFPTTTAPIFPLAEKSDYKANFL